MNTNKYGKHILTWFVLFIVFIAVFLSGCNENLVEIVVEDGKGGNYIFTVEQQKSIAKQVNEVIGKYKSGEYPLSVPEGSEFFPYSQLWPEDLPYPDAVKVSDISYTTEGFEGDGIGATFRLQDYEFFIILTINDKVDVQDSNYWVVSNLGYEKSLK